MKKILSLLLFFTISTNLFSQTYKLEKVFADEASQTFLSYWNPLDSVQLQKGNIFSLWGYQRYDESWIHSYEVVYFKGDAKEMFGFLSYILDFTNKYKNEDGVLTFISGVKIKTLKQLSFRYTLVYDKEGKVVCSYNQKQWTDIFNKFTGYCKSNNITYEKK